MTVNDNALCHCQGLCIKATTTMARKMKLFLLNFKVEGCSMFDISATAFANRLDYKFQLDWVVLVSPMAFDWREFHVKWSCNKFKVRYNNVPSNRLHILQKNLVFNVHDKKSKLFICCHVSVSMMNLILCLRQGQDKWKFDFNIKKENWLKSICQTLLC